MGDLWLVRGVNLPEIVSGFRKLKAESANCNRRPHKINLRNLLTFAESGTTTNI